MNIGGVYPGFIPYWLIFCGIIMLGYFAMAAGMYWFLSKVFSDQLSTSFIGDPRQRRKTIEADIKLSVLSVLLFALGAACFMACYHRGFTQVYTQLRVQDLAYCAFSYCLVLFIQDTHFYFTHRLFHLPILFKWVHQGHHQSRPPTPWTFFALEPVEALNQIFFLLLMTLIIPMHVGVLFAILITMTIWSVGNHLGFQVIPASPLSHWWGRWCIGSTYHLVHHQRYSQHFGLYFTFWDKVLGTQDTHYETKLL